MLLQFRTAFLHHIGTFILLDLWNFICSLSSSIWINFWHLTVRVIAAYGKTYATTMPFSCFYKEL
jgi:hypothetical protein